MSEIEICPECGSKNLWLQFRSKEEWRSGCNDCGWEGEFPDDAKEEEVE